VLATVAREYVWNERWINMKLIQAWSNFLRPVVILSYYSVPEFGDIDMFKIGVSIGLVFCFSMADASEGFFKPANFPSADGTSKETIQFLYDNTWQMTGAGPCTGIPIGNDTILTASHCLFELGIFKNRILPDLSGAIFQFRSDSASPVIAATGGSFPSMSEAMIKYAKWRQVDKDELLHAYLNDWAVIRVNHGKKCFQTDRGMPIFSGPSVTYIASGFPAKAVRKTSSSDGLGLYLSYGTATADLTQNSYFRNLPEGARRLLGETIGKVIQSQDLILGDIDARPGNSGGPLVDQNGVLRGLVIGGLMDRGDGNSYRYLPDSLIAISVDSIKKSMVLKGIEPKLYFKCDLQK
jgi:hypothetical protein